LGRRGGQTRVIELLLATFMVVAVIVMVMSFTRPLKSVYIRETSDLRRLAYNLLNNMAEAGVFERVVVPAVYSGSSGWNDTLNFFIMSSLPPGLVYYMRISRLDFDYTSGTVSVTPLGHVANPPDFFSKPLYEAESIKYTYVCVGDPDSARATVLYVELVIGYSG